jgi:hypothetical protein
LVLERFSHKGGAAVTTLSTLISDTATTITIASSSGWPDGSNGKFFIVINRGKNNEEKIKITSRTTNVLTVTTGGRGFDDTTAVSHNSGETVELVLTAVELDDMNSHIYDTRDDHANYLNNARHDTTTRHTIGSVVPAAADENIAAVGTTAAAGLGNHVARGDHVHVLGSGSINNSNKFASGVVDAAAIASDAVTTPKILNANVTAVKLASDSVTTPKILNANVTTDKIADSNVTTPKIADSNVTTPKIADSNVTAAKLASDAVTTPKIADSNVTAAKLASDAVTTPKIADSNVTGIKLGTQITCAVTHSVAQNVPNNTVTVVAFNTERFKLGDSGMHSNSILNGRLTAKVAGLYLCNAVVAISPNPTGFRTIRIAKNGVNIVTEWTGNANGSGGVVTMASVTALIALAFDEWVEVQVFQNSGSTLTVVKAESNTPEFQFIRLGPAS